MSLCVTDSVVYESPLSVWYTECGMRRSQHTLSHDTHNTHTVIHCNTLQHNATHCNTLQHTATHCNTLQHTATHCNTLSHDTHNTHCHTHTQHTHNTHCQTHTTHAVIWQHHTSMRHSMRLCVTDSVVYESTLNVWYRESGM